MLDFVHQTAEMAKKKKGLCVCVRTVCALLACLYVNVSCFSWPLDTMSEDLN